MAKISKAMERRLPIYYQGLIRLQKQGIDRVRSAELADYFGIDSSTVRRDFSVLGELGKQGYGYNTNHLIETFSNELGIKKTKAILIGAGSLGEAFLKYNFKNEYDLEIVKAYDVDPSKVGTVVNGIEIHLFDDSCNYMDEATIAIVCVNSSSVKTVMDKLLACKIYGVLNFTSERFISSKETYIHNVDLSAELLQVVYQTQQKIGGLK